MLFDKGVSTGEVITIKLTSGEELVAKLAEETATHYVLSRPLVLTAGPQGIGMVPYLFTVSSDKDIPLNKSTVTVIVPTMKDAADQYIQSTTGIKLV
jgi:hypothetical protein